MKNKQLYNYFRLVLATQRGMIKEDRVPTGIRYMSDQLDERDTLAVLRYLVTSDDPNVVEYLNKTAPVYSANRKERLIRKIAQQKSSGVVNGEPVDHFSAFMVSRVLDKLNPDQKLRLLQKPVREVSAISYKLAARTEF